MSEYRTHLEFDDGTVLPVTPRHPRRSIMMVNMPDGSAKFFHHVGSRHVPSDDGPVLCDIFRESEIETVEVVETPNGYRHAPRGQPID